MQKLRLVSFVVILALIAASFQAMPARAATITVDAALPDDTLCSVGGGYLCKTIQAAINASTDGDFINILAGTYTEPINIESRSNLTLQGAGIGLTILQPATMLDWNVSTYGSSRKAAIREVGSTNIAIDGITLDLVNVQANFNYGLLVWMSTGGSLTHSLVMNNQIPESLGGYYEFGMHLRANAAPYSATNRATFLVSNTTFRDVGRVGMNFHDWMDVTIDLSTFEKTLPDFGYGVEVGSTAEATITNSVFRGFNTPAASDGSTSGGLYIENAFTTAIVDPAIQKNVTVSNNEFYDNQYGVIAASYPGYAGNVDINVAFNNNYVHDNTLAGVILEDYDMPAGSSVTLTGSNNVVTNNAVGYEVYTDGSGDVSLSLTGDSITNNTGGGILADYDPFMGTSAYDINVTGSTISGNSPYGVEAMSGITVNASNNWWGSAAGPGVDGNNGTSGTVVVSPLATTSLEARTAAAIYEVGETFAMDTFLEGFDVYGVQFVINHDNAVLHFVNGATHDIPTEGWGWDLVAMSFDMSIPGTTRLAATMTGDLHPGGANLTGLSSLATWNYTCFARGTSTLSFDTTPGTGTIISDRNPGQIPVTPVDASVECVNATASANGYIKLQGRLATNPHPASWYDTTVTLTCASATCTGSGPYTFTTNDLGYFELVKAGVGSGVAQGNYTISASRRGYLDATKANQITIAAGTNAITTLGNAPTLLGGDVDGNGLINVGDLSAMGGAFGSSVTPDTDADMNGDGFVNIFDLVMVGSNYGLSSSTWNP